METVVAITTTHQNTRKTKLKLLFNDLLNGFGILAKNWFRPIARSFIHLARRCPIYTTEPEAPFDAHLCKVETKTDQLAAEPPSRALIQSRISPRGERIGSDEPSPRPFLHA